MLQWTLIYLNVSLHCRDDLLEYIDIIVSIQLSHLEVDAEQALCLQTWVASCRWWAATRIVRWSLHFSVFIYLVLSISSYVLQQLHALTIKARKLIHWQIYPNYFEITCSVHQSFTKLCFLSFWQSKCVPYTCLFHPLDQALVSEYLLHRVQVTGDCKCAAGADWGPDWGPAVCREWFTSLYCCETAALSWCPHSKLSHDCKPNVLRFIESKTIYLFF